MNKDRLPIPSPCTQDWDAMAGDAVRRHCAVCDKQVIDLSALPRKQAARVLKVGAARGLCVRYAHDEAGQVQFREPPLIPPALLVQGRRLALSAGLAALTSCNPA